MNTVLMKKNYIATQLHEYTKPNFTLLCFDSIKTRFNANNLSYLLF